VAFPKEDIAMFGFEVTKNGKLLGTVEADSESVAMVQFMAFCEIGRARVAAACSYDEDGPNTTFTEDLKNGDVVTIRVFVPDGDDPMWSGVPIARQPPELPPGQNLF
jgi:hypothetical protein